MATLLLRHATLLATFDDEDRVFEDGGLFARDGVIERVGSSASLPDGADEVIDAHGLVVLPGLVCTHHHFYQTLTRNVPAAQNEELFAWLRALYPIWARLDADAIRTSTAVAIAELLLSGCTTAADHCYLWPNGARIDDEIEIARSMGFRLHASRGSMSIGRSRGGLPPDDLVEPEDDILADCERAAGAFHDAARFSMTRVVVAPCSPFSVSPGLMRESAVLARRHGLTLHTHLCETLDEERYCLETFGKRPAEFAESLGWNGEDVWFAHAVHLRREEIERLGASRTGVAHCATSNMRLGSGIAPLRHQMEAGMRAGLGVDGSASNDGSHMLDEARHALLLQRAARGTIPDRGPMLTAREALRLATRGGAAVLGRDDIGALAPNMAADFTGIRVDGLETAGGAVHDPLAALLFCRIPGAELTVVAGRIKVRDGALVGIDVAALVAKHNAVARRLIPP
ncbi:MAG: 8-oxoguanine deaminase [Candidatus Tyrphobacter sp.]